MINNEAYLGFEQNLLSVVAEWSKTTRATRFLLYTEHGYIESWEKNLHQDLSILFVVAIIVFVYILCTLGSFSPIFCRGVVAFNGALSILLSTTGGFGILFYSGEKIGSLHGQLPFLIIIVGVEQMYAICDAIDQVALEKTPYQRVHEALSHAGP